MTFYNGSKCKVCRLYEFLGVSLEYLIGKMTLNSGNICMVYHPCEILNVSAGPLPHQMTLYTESSYKISRHGGPSLSYSNSQNEKTILGTRCSYRVSLMCELLNGFAGDLPSQMTLYNESSCRISRHGGSSHVYANFQKEKTILGTWCSCRVSLQCELLNVSASHLSSQMTLYTCHSYRVSHHSEPSYGYVNFQNKKTILCTRCSCRVSLQCELSDVFVGYENIQTTLYILNN
jgi:hypothetical protein